MLCCPKEKKLGFLQRVLKTASNKWNKNMSEDECSWVDGFGCARFSLGSFTWRQVVRSENQHSS